MTNTDLKELLDALHDKYNSPDFIADDPISVPHRYTDRADREIAGFLAAFVLRPPHVQRRGPARFRAGPAAYGGAPWRHREFLRDAL